MRVVSSMCSTHIRSAVIPRVAKFNLKLMVSAVPARLGLRRPWLSEIPGQAKPLFGAWLRLGLAQAAAFV